MFDFRSIEHKSVPPAFQPKGVAPDGAESVFYEVWDVFDVDGEERVHRNYDRAFKTEAEAQVWIDKQGG